MHELIVWWTKLFFIIIKLKLQLKYKSLKIIPLGAFKVYRLWNICQRAYKESYDDIKITKKYTFIKEESWTMPKSTILNFIIKWVGFKENLLKFIKLD